MDDFTRYLEDARSANSSMDKVIFGRLVRNGRALAGMSLREAADQFKTAPGTISRWENGYCAPPVISRRLIVRFFNNRIQRIVERLSKTRDEVREPLTYGSGVAEVGAGPVFARASAGRSHRG